MEIRPHPEPCSFIMPPPAAKARQLRIVGMAFMHKISCDASRSAIEVFVAAPASKIDVPFMKLQGDVAGGMSKIPSNHTAFGVPSSCYAFEIKKLAGIVIDGADQQQRHTVALLVEQPFKILGVKGCFTRPR